jgi:hypothetical protein
LPPGCLAGLEQALGGVFASELLVCEVHLAVPHPDLPSRWIDEQVADASWPLAAAVSAAEHGADSRGHLVVVEWLGNVVVRALHEPADPVDLRGPAGQDDDRKRRVEPPRRSGGGADLAEHVEAGGVGQPQVEQQEVGLSLFVSPDPRGLGTKRDSSHR